MKKLIKLVLALAAACFVSSCSSTSPSGPGNTTTVTDSTQLGGIHKLMSGAWWIEFENDTIVKVKDTANVTIITRDTIEHHKRTIVKNVSIVNGDVYYQIETSDTIVPVSGGPSISGMLLLHSATQIGYTIAPNSWFSDSIRVKAYELPLATGKSWQTFSATGDTSMRVLFGPFWVKLHVDYSFNGQSQVPGTVEYLFGGASRTCFEIANTTNSDAVIISDTTIVLQLGPLTDTLVRQNETIMTSKSVETSRQYINADLSIPLWSHSVLVKCDSNHVNNVVERDTTRKGTRVTTYLDARIIQ
jgi:hypothetical protein